MNYDEIKTGASGLINSFHDLAVYIDSLEKDNKKLSQELETANDIIKTYESLFSQQDGECKDCVVNIL